MKHLILIFAMVFSIFASAQSTEESLKNQLESLKAEESIPKNREKISGIQIRSKIAISYNPRSLVKDTVYITIDKWLYEPIKGVYKASVIDYIKSDLGYKAINKKSKFFVKAQVDGLFKALNNPILTTESYCNEMDSLLAKALLMETQSDLATDGKTIYGASPTDWIIPIIE